MPRNPFFIVLHQVSWGMWGNLNMQVTAQRHIGNLLNYKGTTHQSSSMGARTPRQRPHKVRNGLGRFAAGIGQARQSPVRPRNILSHA